MRIEQLAVVEYRSKPFILEKLSYPDRPKSVPEIRLYQNNSFWGPDLGAAEEWLKALNEAFKIWRKEAACLPKPLPELPKKPHRKLPAKALIKPTTSSAKASGS